VVDRPSQFQVLPILYLMNQAQLEKFIVYLQRQKWLIFGPSESPIKTRKTETSPYLTAHSESEIKTKTGGISINRINRPSDLVLDSRLPFFSFKRFFIPEKETLFEYQSNLLKEKKIFHRTALLGVNILDLKAINLYDQVFEKDPYYQVRRRRLLIIGHSFVPEIEKNFFEHQYEEDILEHLPFDIFLADWRLTAGDHQFKVFTSSFRGQRILEHFGYQDYEHIQFSGSVKENQPDQRMIKLRDKLKNSHNQKIWDKLGQKCIECGKCTIACPTCFCFRVEDEPSLKNKAGVRRRCWDSCFYQEFSEVAGPSTSSGQAGHKFLSNAAARIHFWYFHKFARIPDEFDFMGCVGCGRCSRVCPVNIDIKKVLEQIEES
jgi:ferredoxin